MTEETPKLPAAVRSIKQEVAACVHHRRSLVAEWRKSINAQRGKDSTTESDSRRSRVTAAWSLTKTKGAQLYSAQPEVRVTPRHGRQDVAPMAASLAERLNDKLTENNLSAVMDEVTADQTVVGIGAVFTAFETRRNGVVDIPVMPGNPTFGAISVPRITDSRFTLERISPQNLLWPISFKGSDFERATWIGRDVSLPWARAKVEWKLTDAEKEKVVTQGRVSDSEQEMVTTPDLESDPLEVVYASEIFYRDATYDAKAPSFKSIKRLVLVRGKEEPAIHEPWNGQKAVAGGYAGACRFPIQVNTLSRVPDEPIPPSDVAVSRPMEELLEESAENERLQQKHSIPMRGYDVNKLDAVVADQLDKGEWQGLIPTIGDPATIIKALGSAHYPPERTHFDMRAERQIQEAWALPPASYATGERSAQEAKNVQASAGTRIVYERGKTAHFITRIAEVLAGLIALYDDGRDLPEEKRAALLQLRNVPLETSLLFHVDPDSLVVEEASAQIERLTALYSNLAPSGYIEVEPILRKIVALAGENPDAIVRAPMPKSPEPVNISVRSAEDLLNPLFLGLLMKTDQAPNPAHIAAAQQAIRSVMADTTVLPALQMALKGTEPHMAAVSGADAGMKSGNSPAASSQEPPPGGPSVDAVDANPRLETAPRVNRRRAQGETGEVM